MMLAKILREFERAPGSMCLNELAERLGRPPSSVEGMLQTLVQRGKLMEISAEVCDTCAARSLCLVISPLQRTFALAPLKPEEPRSSADERPDA